MTPSRFGRIDRRRLVASSVIGSAAILAAGQVVRLGPRGSAPAVLAQNSAEGVPMFQGSATRSGEMPGPGPDHSTGVDVVWRFDIGEGYVSTAAASKNAVFFTSNSPSGVSRLWSVDTSEGAEHWSFAFDETASPLSSPAVVGGIVYVGSVSGTLYAIDADSGTTRWTVQDAGSHSSSPAVVDGVVYAGAASSLYALDAASGSEQWQFITEGPSFSSPAVVDGVVYFSAGRQTNLRNMGNDLFALDAKSGLERWRFEVGGYPGGTGLSAIVNVDGVVYFSCPGPSEYLYALNSNDGTERWRFSVNKSSWSSSPAVVDGVVYSWSDDQNLYALDAYNGTELWRFSAGTSSSSPVVVDSLVYITFETGNLRAGEERMLNICAVDSNNGIEQWRQIHKTGTVSFSSPIVLDGIVIVGGTYPAGHLFAIGSRIPRLRVDGTARIVETTTLRGGPAPTTVERAKLKASDVVTITGESVQAGNIIWWPVTVQDTGAQGWVEASKLVPLAGGEGAEPTEMP